MTYSILGRDPATGEFGVAVQSKFPGVGTIVPHGDVRSGVLATQAFSNPAHAETGLELLRLGATAEEAGAILLRGDEAHGQRQVALLDRAGGCFAHTGAEVEGWDGWAGSHKGPDCVAISNSLAGPEVVSAMTTAFGRTRGDTATRLIAALHAGQAAGGEIRGQQAAALLVFKEGGGYGGRTGRHVDIPVYDHPTPIDELGRCYALHRLSYFPSDPANLVGIDGALATELRDILRRRGYLAGEPGGPWGAAEIAAMARFMGAENYDNRIRDDGLIDREVLADIRAKMGE